MNKGVLFDVDGTLLDSMKIWDELPYRYLSSLGIQAEPKLADIVYPMTLEESSSYLKNQYHLMDSVEKIKSDILEIMEDFYRYEVQCKEGVIDYLQYLNECSIPMGIVTIGDKKLIESAFQRLKILSYFEFILTCDEYKTSKKESLIYEIGKEKLSSTNVYVFEDVLQAIQSANKAGCITVAVYDASNQKYSKELRECADFYIEDFKHIPSDDMGAPLSSL